VVLNWAPAGGKPPQGGVSPYALYNMESLLINKYICFYSLFGVRGVETKDSYLRGFGERKVKNHCSGELLPVHRLLNQSSVHPTFLVI